MSPCIVACGALLSEMLRTAIASSYKFHRRGLMAKIIQVALVYHSSFLVMVALSGSVWYLIHLHVGGRVSSLVEATVIAALATDVMCLLADNRKNDVDDDTTM